MSGKDKIIQKRDALLKLYKEKKKQIQQLTKDMEFLHAEIVQLERDLAD